MPDKSSNGIAAPLDDKTIAFFDEGNFAYYECKENRDYFLDKQPQSVFKYISDEIHEQSVKIHRKQFEERTLQMQMQKRQKQQQQQQQQRNFNMAPLPLINNGNHSGNSSVNGTVNGAMRSRSRSLTPYQMNSYANAVRNANRRKTSELSPIHRQMMNSNGMTSPFAGNRNVLRNNGQNGSPVRTSGQMQNISPSTHYYPSSLPQSAGALRRGQTTETEMFMPSIN